MRPFDAVILNQDLTEHNIRAGTQGAIVDVYQGVNDVFVVEFFDKNGNTLDVVDVRADQMTVTLADFFDGERVALLEDMPAHGLLRGQVGVIRARTGRGVYDVEFADASGAVYARVTLHARQMLLLHWQPAEAQRSA